MPAAGHSEFGLEVRRELARQRGLRLGLLVALDEKNLAKSQHNGRVEAQRRRYTLKANGRGRPPLRRLAPSKEDEARRLCYVTEIRLFDHLLGRLKKRAPASPAAWLGVLKAELQSEPPLPEPAARLWRRKLEQLIAQFGPPSPPRLAPRPAPWLAGDVLAFVGVLVRAQRAKIEALGSNAITSLGAQAIAARERARLRVLERLWRGGELTSPNVFAASCALLKADGPPGLGDADRGYHEAACEEVGALVLAEFAEGAR